MTTQFATPSDVVGFWREAGPARWFTKDAAFDEDFKARALALHETAAQGDLDPWSAHPEGALALMILLDQLPRNAFRNTPRMFATDAKALELAKAAVAAGHDAAVADDLRAFFYLPFEHAEDLDEQERAVALMTPLGGESLAYAEIHRDVIRRFGRFPHRNAILGRKTTPDEQRFLDEGGFAG